MSIWHICWHIMADIHAFYLVCILAFYGIYNILALYLANLWALFWHVLASILAHCLAYFLTLYHLASTLVPSIIWHYLAFDLAPWHSIWLKCWHSTWHFFCVTVFLAYIPAIYRAYALAPQLLTFLLAFFLSGSGPVVPTAICARGSGPTLTAI